MPHHQRPPLPECPLGENRFDWIIRTAPLIRAALQEIAELERREISNAKYQEAQPAIRTQAG